MSLLFLTSLLILTVPAAQGRLSWLLQRGDNGGIKCAACVVLVGLTEQLAEIYNETIADSLARFCKYLPFGFQNACKVLVDEYGPGIIAIIENTETPDIACYGLNLCKHNSPTMCHLFPLPANMSTPADQSLKIKFAIKRAITARGRPFVFPDLCNISIIKEICKFIDKFGDDHEPLEDVDNDGFSKVQTFRGSAWRGKDCNDLDNKIYPGRHTTGDGVVDSNCNGILGIDTSTGRTYEDQWCNGTKPMGTAILGDSVGAHFHIPPEWLTAKDLNTETFKDLFFILENEFDWPMLSFTTGYADPEKWRQDISGPVESLYLKFRARNRCNHRDFQNIAVNGARSSSMKEKIMKTFSRNPTLDNPVLVSVELVGNDVCNAHHDMSHMTKPDEYYNNMHSIFQYLDTILPPGSAVLGLGLVDGRVLYESLHNQTHPIGKTRNDVTYSQFYDYLNCLQVSPCFGWMNSNETWRNLTTERAMELNNALKQLIANTSYTNIKVYDFPVPITEVFKRWEAKGGHMWELIEPVDGFHPNQLANALTANVSWEILETKYPQLIPPLNPFNDYIEKQFGDQGGY